MYQDPTLKRKHTNKIPECSNPGVWRIWTPSGGSLRLCLGRGVQSRVIAVPCELTLAAALGPFQKRECVGRAGACSGAAYWGTTAGKKAVLGLERWTASKQDRLPRAGVQREEVGQTYRLTRWLLRAAAGVEGQQGASPAQEEAAGSDGAVRPCSRPLPVTGTVLQPPAATAGPRAQHHGAVDKSPTTVSSWDGGWKALGQDPRNSKRGGSGLSRDQLDHAPKSDLPGAIDGPHSRQSCVNEGRRRHLDDGTQKTENQSHFYATSILNLKLKWAWKPTACLKCSCFFFLYRGLDPDGA